MTTHTMAEYTAKSLQAYGVSAVFFVPTILSKTMYELEAKTDIVRVLTHGEKSAAYMADGYARATGRPGVVLAQTVGAANLAAGLRDPYLANSPLVAITGGPYTWSRHRNQYQEIEDFPLFKSVTKASFHVPTAERFPEMLHRAFEIATTGRPGPVHLELPGHLGELFEQTTTDLPIPDTEFVTPRHRVHPSPTDVSEAVRLLKEAVRPVIVAGGGIRASQAQAELVAVAERLNVPVATSMNGKDLLPSDHPLNVGVPGLYARASANQVVLEADLVFYIGSNAGSQVTLNWTVPSPGSARIAQIDIEPTELGRHYTDAVGILGDAKLTLTQMLGLLTEPSNDEDRDRWVARTHELRDRWYAAQKPMLESDAAPMRPERVMAELGMSVPDDALVVVDTGHSGMWSAGWLDLPEEGQGFIRAAGSLGWGLPASMGAKLGAPERPVVLFTGDGGFWYHIGELETAARRNIATVMVVNNNRSLNQEIGIYTKMYNGELHGSHDHLWKFQDVDFCRVAEAMGVRAIHVDKPAQLQSAIAEAVALNAPVVIDVVTDIQALAAKGEATRAEA
jgi:acetolactate synthase-1/2/3 large subunit